MANKIKGLQIKVGADYQGLDTALKNVESNSKKAAGEIKEINRALDKAGESAELWSQKQKVLTDALNGSKEKLKLLEEAQEQVSKAFEDHKIDEEQYRLFKREVEYARSAVEKYENDLKTANAKVEEFGKESSDSAVEVKDLGDKTEEAGEQADGAAKGGFTVLKGALADLVADGVRYAAGEIKDFTADIIKTGAEFEGSMSQVGAVSGATGDELEKLTKKAEEMGSTTKFTATEAAEAFNYMAMAGWKTEDMLSGIDGILDLAAASGTDLATTSDIVTDALTAMGYSSADAGKLADVMAAASSNANTNVQMMGETFKYVAPIAGALGFDMKDTAVAISLMANSGIKGSQAGTALRSSLSRLSKPTKEMTAAMEQYGLSVVETTKAVDSKKLKKAQDDVRAKTISLQEAQENYNKTVSKEGESSEKAQIAAAKLEEARRKLSDATETLHNEEAGTAETKKTISTLLTDETGKMRSLNEVMQLLREKLGNLDEAQQTQAASAIFGQEAMSGMLAIINSSDEDFNKLTKAMEESDGAAKNMSRTMLDNLQGDMILLDSAVDGLKISLAKELNPEIRKGVQYLTEHMPSIEKGLSKVFGTAIDGLKLVGKYGPDVIDVVKTMKPLILGTLSAIATYKVYKKIDDITKGIKAMNLAMSATLYVAVGTALAVLTAYMAEYINSAKDVKSYTEEAAEKFSAEREAIKSVRESLGDLNERYYESAEATNNEMKRTEDLWKELDNLTDSTGKVKEADKKRAEYILGELNTALGTEYTMTGNQIDQYKKMGDEIENLIAKKKASAYLDSYIAQSAEYAKNQAEARTSYETAYANYNSADEAVKNAAKKIIQQYGDKLNITEADLLNPKSENIAGMVAQGMDKDDNRKQLYREWQTALAERSEHKLQMNTSQNNYKKAVEYQSRLSEAEKAFESGDYKKVSSILYDPVDADKYILKNETDIDKRTEAFKRLVEKTKGDFELAINSDSQYAVDEALSALQETFEAGSLTGEDLGKTFAENFADKVQKMIDKGYDTSSLSKWAHQAGIKVGDVFKKDFGNVVQTQLNKGYDISALTTWARDSGIKITDVFGKNMDFKSIIREQIKGGHDIKGLLTWAEESGYKVGAKYDAEFAKEVQKGLNEMNPNDAKMAEWAQKKGMSLGELFGKNFSAYATQYLYENNDLIPHNINSQPDAMLHSQGKYGPGVSKNATGNFLGIGKTGVIAEAGPELLQVMNGGVKITPLSRTATNRAAEGGNVENYYQTFNVSATIRDDYDVRKLSEKLGQLSKSNNFGKGLVK